MLVFIIGYSIALIRVYRSELLSKKYPFLFSISMLIALVPSEYFARYFNVSLPILVRFLPLLYALGLASAISITNKKIESTLDTRVKFFLILLVIFNLISSVFSYVPIIRFVFAHRFFLLLYALSIIFYFYRRRITVEYIIQTIIGFGLINFIVSIFQRIYVTFTSKTGDMITGLFSVDKTFLFFQLVCLIIVLHFMLLRKNIYPKIKSVTLVIIFIFSIAIANNKAGMAFVIGIFIIQFLFAKGISTTRKIRISLVVVPLLVTAMILFDTIWKKAYEVESDGSVPAYFSKDYVLNYMIGNSEGEFTNDAFYGQDGRLRRWASIQFAFNLIKNDNVLLLFGNGMGEFRESKSALLEGRVAKKYPYEIGRTAVAELLGEIGIIGLILHIILMYKLVIIKRKNLNNSLFLQFLMLLIVYSFYENLYSEYIFALVLVMINVLAQAQLKQKSLILV